MFFILSEALLLFLRFLFRKHEKKTWQSVLIVSVKILLAVAFAVLPLAGPVQLRPAQPFMMAAYAALLPDAAADIVYGVYLLASKKERSFKAGAVLGLVFGAAFFVFGVVNMQTVKPEYRTFNSDKLSHEYNVVFMADMHIGSPQLFSTVEKTVGHIKDLNADAVILGGDIVDDYTTKDEMEKTFALFKDFGAPVYYVFGNHDRQGHAEYAGGVKFTEEDLLDAMEKNGVTALRDEFVVLGRDLLILGREDLSETEKRKSYDDITNPSPDAFLLVADHQPNDFDNASAFGADLQLSGHTHAGQLFPMRFLYSLIGGAVWGEYEKNGKTLFVSSGFAGWRVPFRTDASCRYEVITLKP
ncbi:MAG: metallophosphoesterase, partial [Clostridia bacterium]|nr:metallophosphoesterase [Clostridia bacterium]